MKVGISSLGCKVNIYESEYVEDILEYQVKPFFCFPYKLIVTVLWALLISVFFLGELPGEWSFSIAGQLTWVNLLYEILSEAIVLPLFFFIGKVLTDKKEFANCITIKFRTLIIVTY